MNRIRMCLLLGAHAKVERLKRKRFAPVQVFQQLHDAQSPGDRLYGWNGFPCVLDASIVPVRGKRAIALRRRVLGKVQVPQSGDGPIDRRRVDLRVENKEALALELLDFAVCEHRQARRSPKTNAREVTKLMASPHTDPSATPSQRFARTKSETVIAMAYAP